MLHQATELIGFDIRASDGELGKSKDLLFDDQDWAVRYLVVDTGNWLEDRKVVLSPESLEKPDWDQKALPANQTTEQIEQAPPLREHQPVSRQYQMKLHSHFGWPFYWTPYVPTEPTPVAPVSPAPAEAGETETEEDPHLRSAREIENYHVDALDDDCGHIEDLIVDCEDWIVRYLVIDTRNWIPGRKVLIAPSWLSHIDWAERSVRVDLTRESIEGAPDYDPAKPINRSLEEDIHSYYDREGYWRR